MQKQNTGPLGSERETVELMTYSHIPYALFVKQSQIKEGQKSKR